MERRSCHQVARHTPSHLTLHPSPLRATLAPSLVRSPKLATMAEAEPSESFVEPPMELCSSTCVCVGWSPHKSTQQFAIDQVFPPKNPGKKPTTHWTPFFFGPDPKPPRLEVFETRVQVSLLGLILSGSAAHTIPFGTSGERRPRGDGRDAA